MHLVISPLVGPHQWLYKVADQAWSQNLHDNNKREPGSIRNLNEIFWLRVCEVAMNDFLDVIVRGIREMPRLTHFRLEIYHSEFIIHRFDLRITDQRAHATWSSHPPPPFRPSEAVLASFNSLMHDRGLLFEFECIALPFPMYKFTGNPLLDYIEYF
ncbi:hypothetical protein RRF57_000989 [Xylaria bambusicola]|uniref:Uncharacterized protein n=1 Tax=Xylaria bambusicola TaxID=326684 RepID=A0AAN7UB56_9PEZI